MRKASLLIFILIILINSTGYSQDRWSEEKANAWYSEQPWLVGCNFIPSTAINQLEMWQKETFDLETIDRELGWAESIGFKSIRVYLHNLLWQQDSVGFLNRMDNFLAICDKHGIGVIFVLFDGVWDPNPHLGKQRDPRPHVHNSGWVQSPGADLLLDPSNYDELKPYVQGVIKRFKNDKRVQIWDLFNEPDNTMTPIYASDPENKPELAKKLLEKAFTWAREINPTQPLTAGIWRDYEGFVENAPIFQFILEQSDVITFHNYSPIANVQKEVEALKKKFNRPLICTEFMARTVGSNFDPILGYYNEQNVGAFCWGLVDGKTQTIYPWDSWEKEYTDEPPQWHHDIFRSDGEPYRQDEVNYIRKLTRK